MRNNRNSIRRSKAVSSVVAVALMVAVVVALVGLVSVVVFNFTDNGDANDSIAGGTVDLTATQDGVQVTLVREGDAEEYVVNVDGEVVGKTLTEAGDTTTVSYEGLYSVIGRFSDGSEQVITSKRVEGTLNGLFKVIQDQETNEVEAQLVKRYQNDSEYTIITDTSGSETSSTTVRFDGGDDGKLLSRRGGELLQQLPEQVPEQATEVANIGVPGESSAANAPFEVGEAIELHKMMGSWCQGDDILLAGENSKEILDGSEFSFDYNCGGLQTISQFDGSGDLTGVKFINRWQQDVSYSMLAYQGNVEPPKIGVASGGNLGFDIEVYQQDSSGNIDTSSPIEGAEVVLGNKESKTDADGLTSFSEIPANERYFVTVNAGGFNGTQSPLKAIDDGSQNFDTIELSGNDLSESGNSPFEALDDDGKYNLNGNTLQIGLAEFDPNFQKIQRTVPSGETRTVDYGEDINVNSGTKVSVSAGTGSANSGGGGSGGGSYTGGSLSGGASFYSGTTTTTTQNIQTNSAVFKEPETASTVTDTGPSRVLQLGVLDESEIPVGEQIGLEMTARANSQQQLDDKFVIYRSNTDNNNDPVNISAVDITLPPGDPGNEVTKTKDITIDSSSGFSAGEEYVIYVGLKSGGQLKEAGTVDVFKSALTNYNIDLSGSTSTLDQNDNSNFDGSSDLSQAIVGDRLQLDFNSVVDGNIASGEEPTVDLYRNGELVRRIQDYTNSQEFVYTEKLDEAQFVDYHIGIKESTETALFDTAIVQEVEPASDTSATSTFDAQLNLFDSSNCDSSLTNNKYDCELQIGAGSAQSGQTEPITFEADGSFGAIERTGVEYELDFNNGTVEGPNNYNDITDSSNDDHYTITYKDSGTYLVQLTSTFTDGNGNEIRDVSTATVNVIKPAGEVTGRLVGGGTIGGSESFRINLESTRTTTDEEVDVKIKSAVSDPGSGVDVSGSYKIKNNFTLRGGVTESIDTTVPKIANELSPSGTSEDDAVAALTATGSGDVSDRFDTETFNDISAGDVPLYVRVENAEDSVSTSPKGDQSILVRPDGQIEANIQADVIVNPAITFVSGNDGDDSITVQYNEYNNNLNEDTYKVEKPDNSELATLADSSGEPSTQTINEAGLPSGQYTIINQANSESRTVFLDP